MLRCLILLTLFFTSCGPSSMEEYRREGRDQVREIVSLLEPIQSKRELKERAPLIKKKFNQLVDLMIEARSFYETHPNETFLDLGKEDFLGSKKLRGEFYRLERFDGGKEILSRLLEESLHKLDRFEKKLKQSKERIL